MKHSLMILMLLVAGCSKERNDCQAVFVFCDHYDSAKKYSTSDTLWPWGANNVICQPDLQTVIDYKPQLQGCQPQGFIRIHYSIGRLVNEIKIYN